MTYSRAQTDREALAEQIEAFRAVADALDMPATERAGILGIPVEDLADFALHALSDQEAAGIARRVGYVLPLMRRTLANFSAPPAPIG